MESSSASRDNGHMINGHVSKTKKQVKRSLVCGLPTYPRSQVPAVYREPYIMDGYRKPHTTFIESISYAFVWHNDVCNFWSHLIPLFIWLPWLYRLSFTRDLSQPFYYPLLCFWLGGCSYALFSSIAHLFGSKSVFVRTLCFLLDYLGIAIYVAGGGMYSLYHQFPLSSPLYNYMFPMVCVHLMASLVGALVCSLSRFFWGQLRYVVRGLAFFPAYLTCVSPFLLRLLTCLSTGDDCIWPTLHLHFITIFLTWLLLFFFVSKIPERLAPGRFDMFPQSHTLFHILAVFVTTIQMYMFPIDSELRKEELMKLISPSFEIVIIPFLVMIGLGLLQILVLGVLVVRGVIVPHRTTSTTSSSSASSSSSATSSSSSSSSIDNIAPGVKKQQ